MRAVDTGVAAEVKSASPLNQYGEPEFRVVWSPDVKQWVSGWWNDYDSVTGALLRRVFEARQGPKYQFAPRWIVEQWKPAEFFGDKDMWEAMTAEWSAQHGMALLELGPYPSRGDYIFIWKCETADGKFLEITPTLARYTIDLALLPKPSLADLIADAAARKARDRIAFSKSVDDMVGDAFPFLGRTNNLNPRSLMQKIKDQKKRGKEI
jgi:hypothetical protein